MTKPITFPNPEELGVEDKLSEEQLNVITAEKEQDWNKPISGKEKEKTPEDDLETPEKKDEEEPGSQTPEELEAERKASEESAAEDKRLEEKAKTLNKTVEEVKKVEVEEKAEQERLEKVAKEEGRTIDEIRAEEAKDKALVERHGNDPVKIARALRKEQSEYGKIKNENEELKKFKASVEQRSKQASEQALNARMESDRDKIVDTYRTKYREECEDISDDVVFERAKNLIMKGFEKQQEEAKGQLKTKATEKRSELITKLPDQFKDFVPEIKTLLDECEDSQIIDTEFDIEYLANYARGKKFTQEYIKSLEDASFKRGQEQAKIIPKTPAGRPTGHSKGSSANLSESQKERAVEIYGRREGWTKERMYEEYAANDLKDDSKW